jgi:hypothetical protein
MPLPEALGHAQDRTAWRSSSLSASELWISKGDEDEPKAEKGHSCGQSCRNEQH